VVVPHAAIRGEALASPITDEEIAVVAQSGAGVPTSG